MKEFKKEYKFDGCGKEDLDPHIKDFIIELNKSPHINTKYSCEGHSEGDDAYLYFDVDEHGYKIFFEKILPELGRKFIRPADFGGQEALLQLEWYFNIHNGVSIHTNLTSHPIRNWEDKKVEYWSIIKEVFLNHFKVRKMRSSRYALNDRLDEFKSICASFNISIYNESTSEHYTWMQIEGEPDDLKNLISLD